MLRELYSDTKHWCLATSLSTVALVFSCQWEPEKGGRKSERGEGMDERQNKTKNIQAFHPLPISTLGQKWNLKDRLILVSLDVTCCISLYLFLSAKLKILNAMLFLPTLEQENAKQEKCMTFTVAFFFFFNK